MPIDRMTAADLRELQAAGGKKRPAGINARFSYVDGVRFDSRKEARRWSDLLLLAAAGEIADLRRQVSIPLLGRLGPVLTPTGRPMRYVADFVYIEGGKTIVEDAKGYPSDEYLLKKAILAAQGVHIREV